jgi:phosphopantothenoylcysteine decarboxylase/phosphopantothenate--cysteine ligase
MARILITSGPTREYLDPVRFVSNASSGRMGAALAFAAVEAGNEVVVVTGPVEVDYPKECEVISVTTTGEMLDAAMVRFPFCDGVLGAAAPCDYRPKEKAEQKMKKTGRPLCLHLTETIDIMTELGKHKRHQWMVAFALETNDHRRMAIEKLRRKSCDLIVLNDASVIHRDTTSIEIIASDGRTLVEAEGEKMEVARIIFEVIGRHLSAPN